MDEIVIRYSHSESSAWSGQRKVPTANVLDLGGNNGRAIPFKLPLRHGLRVSLVTIFIAIGWCSANGSRILSLFCCSCLPLLHSFGVHFTSWSRSGQRRLSQLHSILLLQLLKFHNLLRLIMPDKAFYRHPRARDELMINHVKH